ncbi:MAG: methylated-DNA--[protein]-cysteine S-methyltransferase [Cyclobacteriaceae bacterium]
MYDYQRISTAIDFIRKNYWRQPQLDEIAEQVHLSPFHFQRLFTDWAGVSPKKFLKYVSIEHAKGLLEKDNSTLFETAFQTGLSGTSRLHDLFVTIEKMTPGEYKNQGAGLDINYSFGDSPFGRFLVASTDRGVCNVLFADNDEDSLAELSERWPKASLTENAASNHSGVFQFLNHEQDPEKFKLHLKGTDFQLKVWEALLRIPEGQLTSYGHIATEIEQPTASRAVGTAIGSNPVGYIIPCHRVIKNGGGFGNYRWGQNRKMAMIGYEACRVYKEAG